MSKKKTEGRNYPRSPKQLALFKSDLQVVDIIFGRNCDHFETKS